MVKKIVPVLSKGGVSLKYKPEHYECIEIIKKIFTIEYYGFNHTISIARGYRLYKNHNLLVLPKFGFIHYLNNPETQKVFNKLGIYHEKNIVNKLEGSKIIFSEKFIWKGKSNSYQKLVIDCIMKKYFSDEKLKLGIAGVILNLPTGHGKTFVAMALIDKIRTSTLYICPTKKIADQVNKLMTDMFPKLQIGIYHSDNKIDGDIVIGVIDSFALSKNYVFKKKTNNRIVLKSGRESKKYKIVYNNQTAKEFFKRWDFVIFDECHNYVTEKNSQIFSRLSSRYTLGLSATPNQRQDSFDIICQWNIGPILHIDNIPNYLDTYRLEDNVPIFRGKIRGIKYHGPEEHTKNILDRNGTIIPHKMIEQIMADSYRIKLIINFILELLSKKYCILIFADRISYLRTIKKKLELPSLILDDLKDKQIIQVTGGASDSDMNIAYSKANIIFTTYPFFKEGISIPRINSIIYATPRKNGYEQTNGRCIRPSISKDIERREKENNKVRIIIDIIDWEVRTRSQWYVRKKAHEKMNEIGAQFEIEMRDIKFSDI